MFSNSSFYQGGHYVVGVFRDRSLFFCLSFLRFRSIIASCVCELAESNKGFLVELLPYSTLLSGLFHSSINECVQSFGLLRDKGRMDRVFLLIGANKEL